MLVLSEADMLLLTDWLSDMDALVLCESLSEALVLPEVEAHGAGQDARKGEGAEGGAHEAAHRGAESRRGAEIGGDGARLPHRVRGVHDDSGEAHDIVRPVQRPGVHFVRPHGLL